MNDRGRLERDVPDTAPSGADAPGAAIGSSRGPAPVSPVGDQTSIASTDHWLPALDGLRTFAILAVFANHAASPVAPGGMIGVDVFFALSGFLITTLLLREFDRTQTLDLKKFYLRRLMRLTPVLLVAAVVLGVVARLLGYAHPVGDSLTAVLGVSNFYSAIVGVERGTIGQSWSLSVEQQFYLLWAPLLLLLLRRRSRRLLLWSVAGLAVVLVAGTAVAALEGAPVSVLYLLPTTRLPELFVGCILAVLLQGPARRRIVSVCRPTPVAALALAALVLPIFLLDLYDSTIMYCGGWVLAATVTCILIVHMVANSRSAVARVFSIPVVVWFGRISYSFYLWHYAAIVVPKLFLPKPVAIVVGFLLATGLAALSYYFVERPFVRLRAASPASRSR
jgi:peptidoglycan/LPS O-acetylase OafA/YrhL